MLPNQPVRTLCLAGIVSFVTASLGWGQGGGGNVRLQVAPDHVEFQAAGNSSSGPLSRNIQVQRVGGGNNNSTTHSYSASVTAGAAWLSVSPSSGSIPGTITVTATPGSLAPGEYSGRVRITSTPDIGSETVDVSLRVQANGGGGGGGGSNSQLVIDPRAFNFIVIPGSSDNPEPREMRVKSTGNGSNTLNWTATATTAPGGPSGWLSITPQSGTTPSSIQVSVNRQGLDVGMYEGTVTVQSGGMSESAKVFLRILGPSSGNGGTGTGNEDANVSGAVQFTPRIVEFRAASPGAATEPLAVPVQISSRLSGLTFSATAATVRGGNWLAISPPADGSVPGSITVFALTNGLVNGVYSGMIHVKVMQGSSVLEQRVIPVHLRIGTTGDDDDDETGSSQSAARLVPTPGAVVLRAVAGASSPPEPVSVGVQIRGGGKNPPSSVEFQTFAAITSGAAWQISVTPSSGTAPVPSVSIGALQTSSLAPGAYRGTVTFQPASGSTVRAAILQVVLIVAEPAGTDSGNVQVTDRDASNFGGSPDGGASVTGVFLNPPLDFQTTLDKPEAVQIMVFSRNGQPMEGASVRLQGLGGGSVAVLEDAGGGVYTGFFQAAGAGPVWLTASVVPPNATASVEPVTFRIAGSINANNRSSGAASSTPAVLALQKQANGNGSATILSLFGRSLAGPDVRVFVGDAEASVLLVRGDSPGGMDQIDVELPSHLSSIPADLVVVRDGIVSAPAGRVR